MSRAANAYKKSGPPIGPNDDEPDNGAAAKQRVVLTSAAAAPPLAGNLAAASSVFALAKKPAKRGGRRAALPPVDFSQLVFEVGIEKPPRASFSVRGQSKYAAIFDTIKPGQSVELPAAYFGAVYAAAKKRKTERYTMRRVSETHCRLWRDA